MQPKVSMVVPCYNTVKWIGEMLDSVIAQKWDNIEVILVNDGSTDGTRDVIAEYEPRLKARGYEVVIVDQENQGLAGAVRNGLMLITGEYICIPDSDDILHSEYVLEMAGYLDGHPEVMWVICDWDMAPCDFESHPALKRNSVIGDVVEYTYKLFESVLLKRQSMAVWNKIYRTSYFIKCGIVTDYAIEPRVAQEPQVVFPIILGEAKPVLIRKVLYYHMQREGSLSRDAMTTTKKLSELLSKYSRLIEVTLRSKGVYNNYLNSLLRCWSIHQEFYWLPQYNISEDDYVRELMEIVNENGLLPKHIDAAAAFKAGTTILYRWFSNIIIDYPQKSISIIRRPCGRVIAYAAYGRASSIIRRGLLNSDIRPDVFWDIAAKPGDQIDGIPVAKPDIENLTENDTVLVLLKDIKIAQDVKKLLEKTLAIENTWYYYDVMDYLAEYYFFE